MNRRNEGRSEGTRNESRLKACIEGPGENDDIQYIACMQSWRLTSFLFKAAPHIRQISCCSSSLVAKGFIARRSVIMSTESGIGVAPADEKSTPLG